MSRELDRLDADIAEFAAYDGPDLDGVLMAWADAVIERDLLLRELFHAEQLPESFPPAAVNGKAPDLFETGT